VRQAIVNAGNTPPERLPAAQTKIDQLCTKLAKQILPVL
jgi:hypothetical protein